MRNVIASIGDKYTLIRQLHKLKLIQTKQANVLYSIYDPLKHNLITRMVSEKIDATGSNDFTNFIAFMKSHWALKFTLKYWMKMCKSCDNSFVL